MGYPTEIPPSNQEKLIRTARADLRLVVAGGAASSSEARDDLDFGVRGQRPWACLLSHNGPPLRKVVLLGADRDGDHISGYRITRPRKGGVAVPYPHVQPTKADVDAVEVAAISLAPVSEALDVDVGPQAVFVAGATGKKRGQIVCYSDGARKRLTTVVLSVGHELLPRRRGQRRGRPQFFVPASLVTLTYHAPNVPKIDVCYSHLRAWWKRVKRGGFPDAWGVFVREYQGNGALHFHLLVHWGVERWTTSWSAMQLWIGDIWADVVAVDMGEDELHRRAGTNIRPVLTQRMLAEYVAKGGLQKLQPGAGLAAERAKRVQKGVRVQLREADVLVDEADRQAAFHQLLEESRGHRWWGYLDRVRFKAHAREVVAEVGPEVVGAVKRENDRNWTSYLEAKGVEVDPLRIPQRASGRVSDRIIEAAGVREQLLAATWVDAKTGEILGEPIEVSAALAVAVGGEDYVRGQVVAEPRAGPGAVQAVPALWCPLGAFVGVKQSIAAVSQVGSGPSGSRVSLCSARGYPLCVRCGAEQFRLGVGGLCIRCDGSLSMSRLPPAGSMSG